LEETLLQANSNLKGRVALITGGGGAIGRAIALAFAERGAVPALVDWNVEQAEKVAVEVGALGGEAMVFQADVRSYSRAREIASEIFARAGRIDVLVNNAGISQPKPFLELTEEIWDLTLDIHLKGGFNYAHNVLPYMIQNQWGRIINMSSMVAKHGGAYPAVSKTSYSAAKAGLIGLTHGLAREAAPYVTVNAICPGVIVSALSPTITEGEAGKRTLELIPLARFGEPADIAGAVMFFASEEASYVTGEVMDVNGGVYID
jgi:3-oxoacyl-[acyl-carrier protein] reductase